MEIAVHVPRHRHFEPVKPAFRAPREFRETAHGLVRIHILFQAHWKIRRVRHVHDMRAFLS